MKLWKNVAIFTIAGVAVLDLLFGNTNKPLLPAFIGNLLTQSVDIVLLAVAAFLYWGI